MRRVLLLVLLALALPLAAAASSIDITNIGGTIAGSASGLSLNGSTVISYGGIVGSNLGTVTFTTGGFASGNVTIGGTLMAGGTLTITGNGSVSGVPNGVIFSGTFTSAQWMLSDKPGGGYELKATFISTSGGSAGHFGEFTLAGTLNENGTITLGSGDIILNSVPEPGTLVLLGTGLVGIGGLVRRKRILG
jgi:hypothetical protein